ncbi:restriction endonuclease subunit S [Staphylococcus caprae]|uniref:restriction endonuclease subunit S n=1 Tax=Staphylococcus caprae TaxID=29380 RepID=UPI003B21D3AD
MLNFFDILDDIVDFRGRTPKKLNMEWAKKGYLALSAINVKNGYIDYNVESKYGDEELYKKWMNGKELKVGQVLFTTEAPMGNVAQIPDNKGYILSQRTIAFETNDKITNDFLALLLKSENTYNNLVRLSSGATAKGVSQKTLKSLYVKIPESLEEQQKIGKFLTKFEKLIEKQSNKVRLLKQRKQGLLQKMFV